jgi:hypothetical protein
MTNKTGPKHALVIPCRCGILIVIGSKSNTQECFGCHRIYRRAKTKSGYVVASGPKPTAAEVDAAYDKIFNRKESGPWKVYP